MRSIGAGRIKVLPLVRRKNDVKRGILSKLWETAPAGSKILLRVRNKGAVMNLRRQRKKIGVYTVVSCIGRGRYGVCFLARDPEGKKVVLKRFRTRMWKKNRTQNHYEAVILSGLKHPAVPELLGVVNSRSGYFFVLEYKEGLTLKSWLFDKKKVFGPDEVLRIGSQMFEILEYLHGRSVVHGDISIANITDDGEHISLLDFGLARYADGNGIRYSLDYARVADVLLYLLYSGYEGKGRQAWYEELSLSEGQTEFLKKLLEEEEAFEDTGAVKRAFYECFGIF